MINVWIPEDCQMEYDERSVLHGMWLHELKAEEIEAARGRKSIIAQRLAKYRMTRELTLERGPYVTTTA